jgi:hypothetical protein
MNTMTFVFGQLLTLEMLTAGRKPLWQRLPSRRQQRSSQAWKEFFMDNNILIIAFLIVSLIANFAMPTDTNGQSR